MTNTALKNRIFKNPKALNDSSLDRSACGVMRRIQAQTPTAHDMLKSLELFRFQIRTISGMLKKGNTIAPNVPIFWTQASILHGLESNYNTRHPVT